MEGKGGGPLSFRKARGRFRVAEAIVSGWEGRTSPEGKNKKKRKKEPVQKNNREGTRYIPQVGPGPGSGRKKKQKKGSGQKKKSKEKGCPS